MNSTPLGRTRLHADQPQHELPAENDILTGREHLAAYLEPLAQSALLRDHLCLETAILHIGRRGFLKEDHPGDARRAQQPFLLLSRNGNRETIEEADVVLDCTGTYSQPRFLGEGGIPALGETAARPHIAWQIEDILGKQSSIYADKTTLVVGSGYSVATTVCHLATLAQKHPGTWVVWLARGSGTQPIKRFVNDTLKERDQLAVRANTLATRGDGNVEFHPQTVVTAIECAGADRGFKVRARCAGKAVTWEADRLIAHVGFTPDTDLFRELHVHENHTALGSDNLPASSPAAAMLRNPEPNFFVLGAKSYGRNSNFLLRTGFEQVRDVFALITGKTAAVRERKP